MDTKIPFYNLLNIFLTGLIFAGSCVVLFNTQLLNFIKSDFFNSLKGLNVGLETIITISFCAIIYEVGVIINRIGSLFENLLKLINAIPFDNNYKKYNEKKKEFPIMETLSREYALSRTSMTLFLIITIIAIIQHLLFFSILLFALTFLFYFSMRKHAGKIVELMK